MRLLLDAHVLIWALDDTSRLSVEQRAMVLDARREAFVSVASLWEITIKTGTGRLRFPVVDLDKIVEASGFTLLPITARHVLAVAELPPIHRDPFDRLLVAQAIAENLTLATADDSIRR